MRAPDEGSERELRDLLARGRYQEALDRFPPDSLEDVAGRPHFALGVATAATRLGALEEGARLAGGALAGFGLRVDDDGKMRCLNLLGAIAYERGRFEEASRAFADSLDLSRILRDLTSWARASNNLASVALQQGRLDESASLYREVMQAYQRLGDRRGLAEASHNLGVANRELGQLAEAERFGEQAVRHAELVGDAALMALALTGQAETAVFRGALDVAVEALDRAARLAHQAGDEIGVAEVERVRAVRWLRLGDAERAAAAAESAREVAQRFGSLQLEAESAAVAMRAHLLLNHPKLARRRRTEAEALFTALGGVLNLARLRAVEATEP